MQTNKTHSYRLHHQGKTVPLSPERASIAERMDKDGNHYAGLYPVSGGGMDVEYINGIVGYILEINGSFQPDPSMIAPTNERFHKANMTFVDEIASHFKKGDLPGRHVPERYRDSEWNISR